MESRKTVLIAEPSCIVAEGLKSILGEAREWDVLTPLQDMELLEHRLITLKPDILIINPTVLPYPGRHALSLIMQTYPRMAVISIVYQYVEPSLLRLFHAQIDIREERVGVSEALTKGVQILSRAELTEESVGELSQRETDVLVLIAKGLMNKEIADRLNISVHTVISHRKNISRKTNIKSAAGLAVYAMMNNLVDDIL